MIVSLKEYAHMHKINYANVRKWVQKGKLHVIDRDYRYTYVDSDEEPPSHSYVYKYGKQPILSNIIRQMKMRCYNPKNPKYKWYGGKGIKICDDWLHSSNSFIEWALNNGYEKGLTIDRIDANKDYCPENCRWITRAENCRRAHLKKRVDFRVNL